MSAARITAAELFANQQERLSLRWVAGQETGGQHVAWMFPDLGKGPYDIGKDVVPVVRPGFREEDLHKIKASTLRAVRVLTTRGCLRCRPKHRLRWPPFRSLGSIRR